MSVISAGTTTTTAFKVTGDTTGTLQLQTGAVPTTAINISATQVVTFPATTTLDFTGTLLLGDGSAAAPTLAHSGDTNTGIYFPGADQIAITTAGTQRFVVDAIGNIGVGVTPSTWGSGSQALQNRAGALFTVGTGSLRLFHNAFYDGTNNKYVNTAAAAGYIQAGGAHQWFNAASGTAGTNATFTQAMTLDASGNFSVGGTAVYNSAANRGNITIEGAATSILNLGIGGTLGGYVYHNGTDIDFRNAKNGAIQFATNGVERARITSTGDVGIGISNPTYKLEIQDTAPRVTLRGTNNGSNVGYRLETKDSGGTQRNGGYYYQPQTGTNESYLGLSVDDSGYQLGVKANGNVFLLGGVTNASGTGITFPATQNASSNANTLDDYEEGTWTPTGSYACTVNSVLGAFYTKIGRLVTAYCYINLTTTSASFGISGLPFTSLNYASVTVGYTAGAANIGSSNYTESATTAANFTLSGNITNTGYMFSVTYFVA